MAERVEQIIVRFDVCQRIEVDARMTVQKSGEGKEVFLWIAGAQIHQTMQNLFDLAVFQQIVGKMFPDRKLIPAQWRIVFKEFLAQLSFQLAAMNLIFIDACQHLVVGSATL